MSYVHELTRFSGTHANFSISVSYPVRETAQLWFKHLSHGSAVGIEPHKRNSGYNFLGVRVLGCRD